MQWTIYGGVLQVQSEEAGCNGLINMQMADALVEVMLREGAGSPHYKRSFEL